MADVGVEKLRRILAKDAQYDRFKSIVKKFSQHEVLEDRINEIFTLHRTRKSRKMHSGKPNPRDVIDAALEDSAHRSRAVEILMQVMISQKAIERAIDNISGYIYTQYGDYIDARTKGERDRVIRTLNTRALYYLDELSSAIDVIREFIKDLDQGGFAVRNTIEALKIIYGRESVVKGI